MCPNVGRPFLICCSQTKKKKKRTTHYINRVLLKILSPSTYESVSKYSDEINPRFTKQTTRVHASHTSLRKRSIRHLLCHEEVIVLYTL
jgi:hypothetical protein